jgi:hypothetical protein
LIKFISQRDPSKELYIDVQQEFVLMKWEQMPALDILLEGFERFLKAAGYGFEGVIEIVPEEYVNGQSGCDCGQVDECSAGGQGEGEF